MASYNAVSALYLVICILLATFFIHHTIEFSKSYYSELEFDDLEENEKNAVDYVVEDFKNSTVTSKKHAVVKKPRKLQFPAGRADEPRCQIPVKTLKTPGEYKSLFRNRVNLDSKNYKSSEQTKILVMAQHRSGSSFFSELFNLHPEVFYLFEPLYQMEFREPEIVEPGTYRV